jgi:hypothetical protein
MNERNVRKEVVEKYKKWTEYSHTTSLGGG